MKIQRKWLTVLLGAALGLAFAGQAQAAGSASGAGSNAAGVNNGAGANNAASGSNAAGANNGAAANNAANNGPLTNPNADQLNVYGAVTDKLNMASQHFLNLQMASIVHANSHQRDGMTVLDIRHPLQTLIGLYQTQYSDNAGMTITSLNLFAAFRTRLSQSFFLTGGMETNFLGQTRLSDSLASGPLNDQLPVNYQLDVSKPGSFLNIDLSLLYVHPLVNVEASVGVRSLSFEDKVTSITVSSSDPKNPKIYGENADKYGAVWRASGRVNGAYAQLNLSRRLQGQGQLAKFSLEPTATLGYYVISVGQSNAARVFGQPAPDSTSLLRIGAGVNLGFQANAKLGLYASAQGQGNFMSYSFNDGSKKNAFGYDLKVGGRYQLTPQFMVDLSFSQYGMGIDGIKGYRAGASVRYTY